MEFHRKEDVCNGNGAFNSDFVRRSKEALKHSLKKRDDSKILVLNDSISTVRTTGKDLLIAILEDSNEEVIKIPKAFENWMKRNKKNGHKKAQLDNLISRCFGGNYSSKIALWIKGNPSEIGNLYKVFIEDAEYELLKEYEIEIPGFMSDNGRQYLTFKKGNIFACASNNNLKQTFYENEWELVPGYYRQFAKEV